MHRLAFPLLMMLLPRFLPRILKYALAVWRLTFDPRVNIVLRALVPAALLYVLLPTDLVKDRIPIIGRFDDIIVFGVALLFLFKLSPQHVVDQHLGNPPRDHAGDDPDNVVDGQSRPVDD